MRSALGVAPQVPLSVIAILTDPDATELISRTLAFSGDQLSVATDLAEGLTRVSNQVPDVALVDVTLGESAGLAVLHHIRALAPTATVFALTRPDRLELGTQALALGGAGMLVLPLAGDDLLTALSDVRTRLGERARRVELERLANATQRDFELVARVAEIAEAESRREASVALGRVLSELGGARRVLVYLPAGEGTRELMRAAALGDGADGPAFCEDMELLQFAHEQKLEVLRLALRRELGAIVLVDGLPAVASGLEREMLSTVSSQAATVFALVAAREQSHRGSMKDPRSSAYTFAYFVDVAGREIDTARRHKRRFALATIGVHAREESGELEPTIATADRVLAAVRDTDVLARVDANEFYLLLPETGGIGAHACRRRVLEQLGGIGNQGPYELTIGLASYPHDGGDLSRLLRVARHRADASRGSVIAQLDLRRASLPEVVDRLVSGVNLRRGSAAELLEAPRYIELPTTDVPGLVASALQEAARGGTAHVAVTKHSGVSVGGALRSELLREGEGTLFEAVDVSAAPGCENLEILAIVAEHGTYALLGRSEGNVVRAVHAADPLLVDLLLTKLGEAGGVRLFD